MSAQRQFDKIIGRRVEDEQDLDAVQYRVQFQFQGCDKKEWLWPFEMSRLSGYSDNDRQVFDKELAEHQELLGDPPLAPVYEVDFTVTRNVHGEVTGGAANSGEAGSTCSPHLMPATHALSPPHSLLRSALAHVG